MSVYKPKGSPYYHYDFQIDGQRFCGSTHTDRKQLAEKYELDERLKARRAPLTPNNLTVDYGIGQYWERHAKFRKSSRDIELKLERLNSRVGENKLIAFLTNSDISDYVHKRRDEVKNASVNSDLRLLRAAINFCGKKLDAQLPKINWTDHFLDEPKGRTRFLTDSEEKRLFKNIREDYHPLINFCLITGCRVSSARNLKWSDIGQGIVKLYVKSKTTDDFLELPISADMQDLFDSAKGHHHTHVFTYECIRQSKREKGKRYPFSETNWRREWARALKAAKIEDFRFHDLRHTAATRMLKESGNIAVVQRVLGHQDITSTLRYAHVNNKDIHKALSRRKSRSKK